MATHETTEVVGVAPRISEATFTAILRAKPSPALGEAGAAWRAVRDRGVDPLFALAVFHHESSFGTDGVCIDFATRSPGNTRSSRTGKGVPVEVPESGSYIRYDTWLDGWDDLAFRLVDPSFVYVEEHRRAVRPIIERWAPRSDGNNVERYIAVVLADMDSWQDIGSPGSPGEPDGPFAPPQPIPDPVVDRVINGREYLVNRRKVRAARDGVPRHLFADPASPLAGPPLRRGEEVNVRYVVAGEDGRLWLVATRGWRMPADGFIDATG